MVLLEKLLMMHLIVHFPSWLVNGVGSIAAFCTTICFLPQLIHVWRRKSARDISLSMFLCFNLGLFLWLVYGIATRSFPIIVGNVVTMAQSLTILALKIRYDRNSEQWSGVRGQSSTGFADPRRDETCVDRRLG
jgi:MtN3 and saliva related transmembrane protein